MSRFITEISALMKLALPVSLAQLALVGMTATDVMIAGNASTVDLAGMNLGTNTWNMIVMFFMGIGFATQPLVAKQFGAQNNAGVKHQLHQSIHLCFVLGVVATLVTMLVGWLILLLDFEKKMLWIASQYMFVIALCAIPATLIPAVRGSLEGMSVTRPVFVINLMVFLINIPLDYALVNGHFGFPKLGGVGCAWATVSLVWCMLFSYLLVLVWHKKLQAMKLLVDFQKPNWQTIAKTIRMGLPIGLSIVIELSMFCGAGMLIASFGEVAAGAHAVAITIASMSFVLYMGLGQGVTIRAAQFLGAERPSMAWYCVKAGTALNVGLATLICIVFLLYNERLANLFSADMQVIKQAQVLLYFAAAFQIADSLQVAIISALRAYHDTSSPPKYQLISFWLLGLPLGIGLAFFGWWPGLEGAKGLWMGMVASLFLVSILMLRRLNAMVKELMPVSQL